MAVKGKSPKQKDAKNIPLGDIIKEEAEEAKVDQFSADEEFDADRDLGFGAGPSAFHRSAVDRDALVIDELLTSLPKNQGYYLKLYREIMPGKFEFKDQINNYDTWTDLELEISNLVKAMTRKFGAKKWGSGLYRLIVWKQGGIREKNKYPAIDVIVDAGDNEDAAANIHTGKVDPIEAANEQLGALGNMLSAVQGIMPKPVDPNVQFSAIANAFIAGKGEQANGNNQMMTMMMTMMTGLISALTQQRQAGPAPESPDVQMARQLEMIKSMHALVAPSGPGAPVKSLIEQIAELKALGIDLFKKEDTIEVLAKMKAIMSSAGEIVPGAAPVERPGIFEKLVDAIAPSIPKIIGDLRTISENATIAKNVEAAKMAQNGSTQQASLAEGRELPPRPTTRYGQPIGPAPNRMGAGDAFVEPPDMDPYSGFTTRPSDQVVPTDERTDDWASNFATPEQLRNRHLGIEPNQVPIEPQKVAEPQQNQNGNGQMPDAVRDDGPIDPLLQEIGNLIVNDLREAYPNLFATLMQSTESMMMLNMAKTGAMKVETMVEELQKAGGKRMQTPDFKERAQTYLTGFVDWMREYENGQCRAICNMCQAVHVFESKGEFVRSPKVCLIEGGGQQCQGTLTILVNEDAQEAITSHSGHGHSHK